VIGSERFAAAPGIEWQHLQPTVSRSIVVPVSRCSHRFESSFGQDGGAAAIQNLRFGICPLAEQRDGSGDVIHDVSFLSELAFVGVGGAFFGVRLAPCAPPLQIQAAAVEQADGFLLSGGILSFRG
jgi:hypothetical protein